MAILSGACTRNASVSFVLAFALVLVSEKTPTLIITITDATRNAETFLNILSPQKWRTNRRSILNFWLMLGSALGCSQECKGLQGGQYADSSDRVLLSDLRSRGAVRPGRYRSRY